MLEINFNPFPELETKRLRLRAVKMEDRQEVFALRSNPLLMQYIAKPLMKTMQDAEKHIQMLEEGIAKNEFVNWAITLKGKDKLMGIIGFYRLAKEHYRTEVGYMLLEEYHRQGITQEALWAVINFGFNTIGFHKLEAITDDRNTASGKLLQKCGFVKEAHFRENCFFEGKFLDSVHYGCLKSEWKLNPGGA